VKAAIQNTGKLGFTESAIKKLKINENKAFLIGLNTADPKDKNLYIQITTKENEDAFRINKAGKYYYVNTKQLFDEFRIPYKTKRISFDIEDLEIPEEGFFGYKFIYNEAERKSNEDPDLEQE
jgi:hypothetical protein